MRLNSVCVFSPVGVRLSRNTKQSCGHRHAVLTLPQLNTTGSKGPFVCLIQLNNCVLAAHPCIVLQHEGRDVDLLGLDAGEELLQVVQVANLVLHPRHAEGGEEPRGDLEDAGGKRQERGDGLRKVHRITFQHDFDLTRPRWSSCHRGRRHNTAF